ncbi:MBL fold metallo-hydrolase [Halococcus dombrowskii]|uniref:MBL fold metallo-hydrolase n=1 Tax=Halococcus dombrowskii TaxID=179637 RepID=A0AAV3SIG9_HALDO|nr:MBL fold metallo-hydrolase [Halococcus dombrowskii]UOO93993.1 MBL fold metallo-hydrolase [Halococcus dombrowskii]
MFGTITARDLAARLDRGDESYVLIDTRPAESYDSWRVTGAENVPFGPAEGLSDDQRDRITELADGDEVLTICGKGATSTRLASELDADGFSDVSVVTGGMRAWNELYETATVETASDDLIVRQFQRRAKGCLSYLVGSERAGEAIVVDPTRHTDQYITTAAEHGLQITGVLDTHVHADHISGGRELATRLDVPYYLGEKATERDLAVDFEPLSDGETLSIGNNEIETLATPGHTTEMVAYRVDDVVLTGDSLFLDSVGRTELEFGEEGAEAGARMQYETLHDTLLELPDELIVLPGHVTVHDDGTYATAEPGELVGAKLGDVHARLDLVDLDEDAFVERMIDNIPEKPDNYETIIAINRGVASTENDTEATTLETGANNCAA